MQPPLLGFRALKTKYFFFLARKFKQYKNDKIILLKLIQIYKNDKLFYLN